MNAKVSEQARQIDHEQYYNNPEISDVTIRYGPLSNKIFYGHRKILASQSLWFQKAFEGQIFKESHEKEITLQGDVPTALEKMFEFVYFHRSYPNRSSTYWNWESKYWKCSESPDSPEARVYSILNLYEVADKYDVPEIVKEIPFKFHSEFQDWVHSDPWWEPNGPNRIPVTKEGLFNIIERVYDLTGAWQTSELRDELVRTISSSEPFRTYQYTWNDEDYDYGIKVHWLRDYAKAIPDFGKDLFLYMIPRFPPKTIVEGEDTTGNPYGYGNEGREEGGGR